MVGSVTIPEVLLLEGTSAGTINPMLNFFLTDEYNRNLVISDAPEQFRWE
jgi:hypothetical protein